MIEEKKRIKQLVRNVKKHIEDEKEQIEWLEFVLGENWKIRVEAAHR